ncbi:MAG: N-acetylmuramoyl-L-alanine amidase, partial [Calditrichaeota bacterium]|nr:N-acetylmuramoyl-L-alanine amidase [Calditrichota bacterium]
MKPLLLYLLQVIVISGLLYGYYHLALRNKTFHRYNRFYLIAAALLSIIIPFLNIPLYFSDAEKESSFVLQTLTVISSPGGEETFAGPVVTQTESWFTWQNMLTSLYILVGLIVLIRLLISLVFIRRVLNNNPVEKIDRIRFVNTAEPSAPFSFFRWMFWNKKIELQSEKGQQIFRHELFHIEQKHSADIILLELISVVFWINPFFHLIKKEIKAIHEFLADRFAIKENKHWEYAELLLMQALDTSHHLVNPFFHNQIKRRIAMITTSQKPGPRYFRKIMVLPLTALAVILFAFSYRNKTEKEILTPEKPFTVVIDAGHGGEDAGAFGLNGIKEKNINLAVALKIKELNKDKNLNIVLTREDDSYPDLQGRNDLTIDAGADLFISIHVSSAPHNDQKRGMEVFIASQNKTYMAENKILGTILLSNFSQIANTDMGIKQRAQRIYVLEQAPCPSVLIECGFISNKDDLAFVKESANQKKIAKAILDAIDQYRMQKEDEGWEARKSAYRNVDNITPKLKDDFKNIKRLENYNGQSKTVIEADSIVFHGNSSNPTLSKDQVAI